MYVQTFVDIGFKVAQTPYIVTGRDNSNMGWMISSRMCGISEENINQSLYLTV